jgi:hypothetical protein
MRRRGVTRRLRRGRHQSSGDLSGGVSAAQSRSGGKVTHPDGEVSAVTRPLPREALHFGGVGAEIAPANLQRHLAVNHSGIHLG